MSDSWNKSRRGARHRQDNQGGGMFLSLKDGDQVDIVFLGEVRIVLKQWNQASGRYDTVYPEAGPNGYIIPKGTSVRYASNVFNVGEAAVQIIEFSEMAFDDVSEEVMENGLDNVYRVSRRGTGTDTKYRCRVVRDSEEKGREIRRREGDDSNLHEIHDSHAPDEIDFGDGGGGGGGGSSSSSVAADHDRRKSRPKSQPAPDYSKDDDIPF